MHLTKMQEARISQIEWEIRKTERGIKVLHAQGADRQKIIEYGEIREKLKDRLEGLTQERYFSCGRWKLLREGRRIPKIPEWPL
jgi:hypothetical protein